MNASWKIVFRGECLPGFERATVKENFARLLRISKQEAERFFSGQEITLKKNLSEAEARQYVSGFEKRGIQVQLVAEASASFAPDHQAHGTTAFAQNNAFAQQQSTPYENSTHTAGAGSQNPYSNPGHQQTRQQEDFNDTYYNAPDAQYNDSPYDDEQIVEPPPILAISFTGRYGRLNFTNAYVAMMGIIIGLFFVTGLFSVLLNAPWLVIALAVVLAILVLAYTARIYVLRLHDLGMPGWYAAPILGVPFILGLIPILNIIGSLANFMIFILMLAMPGKTGVNAYGPPSRQGSPIGLILLIALTVLFVILLIVMFSVLMAYMGGMR